MSTLVNFLCLAILCVYAQTANIVLFVISLLYLSAASIGCALVAFNKSQNMKWIGWGPYIFSLVISSVVVYFTFQSPIGLWYFCICCFSYGVALSTK